MAVSIHPVHRTANASSDRTGPFRIRHRIWAPLLRDGVRPLFIAGDVVACLTAGVLTRVTPLETAIVTMLIIVLYAGGGLYRSRLVLSLLDDLPELICRWLIAVGLVLAIGVVLPHGAGGIGLSAVAGVLLLLFRVATYGVVHLLRRRRIVAHSTLILGDDPTTREIAQHLLDQPKHGLAPFGFLGTEGESPAGLPVPILGTSVDLPSLLVEQRPSVLIVGRGAVSEQDLVSLVRSCQRNSCEVFVVPRLYELQHVSADMELVWDVPLVRLRRAAYRSPAWRLKRVLDFAVAVTALVLLSPLLAICAIAVFCEGGRGVIFSQERVGCDGRHFQLLKFRSMRPINEQESQTQWNIARDDRVGLVGRLLRVSSLDELPQLFNILRGDMSLVGPRPERPHYVAEFGHLYRGYGDRHRVPCGLTGWAQVHGLRGDTSIGDRARFDNFYIENWSLWLDLKIILRTAVSVFTSPGA